MPTELTARDISDLYTQFVDNAEAYSGIRLTVRDLESADNSYLLRMLFDNGDGPDYNSSIPYEYDIEPKKNWGVTKHCELQLTGHWADAAKEYNQIDIRLYTDNWDVDSLVIQYRGGVAADDRRFWVDVDGNCGAAAFYGDGSNLTGITAGAGADDTAYGPSWNGVTTIPPSKNAVFDKIELLAADIVTNTTNITANTASITTINGTLANCARINTVNTFTLTQTFSGAIAGTTGSFSGNVTVPNQAALNNSTKIANTKYVDDAVGTLAFSISTTFATIAYVDSADATLNGLITTEATTRANADTTLTTAIGNCAKLNVANTFTTAGAVSAPSQLYNGAVFTGGSGTTTHPFIYWNGGVVAPATWSTNGTVQGFNAAGAFTGNFVDYHVNGAASVFKVDYLGAATLAGAITGTTGAFSGNVTFPTQTQADNSTKAATTAYVDTGLSNLGGSGGSQIAYKNAANTFTLVNTFSSGITLGAAGNLFGGTDILEQYRSTNAQVFNVYRSRTDSSNGSWLRNTWSSNDAVIETVFNGTGTVGALILRANTTTGATITLASGTQTVTLGSGATIASSAGTLSLAPFTGVGLFGTYSCFRAQAIANDPASSFAWSNTAANSYSASLDTYLTRRAAAGVNLGLADAAAAVAQTLSVQSVVAGTTNTAGATWTLIGSRGTGTGTPGDIVIQTGLVGTTGSVQHTLIDHLRFTTVSTAPGALQLYDSGSVYNTLIVPCPTGQPGVYFGRKDVPANRYLSVGPGQHPTSVGGFGNSSGMLVWWTSSTSDSLGTIDVVLRREGAGILGIRHSTTAQSVRISNTYTDASNNEYFTVDWTSNLCTLKTVANGTGTLRGLNITAGSNVGIKFGTATTDKLAFWNTAPIVQPTTAGAASTFVANTSAIANDTATWDGYTAGQVVKALRNVGLLA